MNINIITILFILLSTSAIGEPIPDEKIRQIHNELNQNAAIKFFMGNKELMNKYKAALIKNEVEHTVLDSGAIQYKRKDKGLVKTVLDQVTACHFEKKCN